MTSAVPVAAISVAVTCAVICVSLTKVVASWVAFHHTTEPLTKPVPLTVKVNEPPPEGMVDGKRLVTVGIGFAGVRSTLLKTISPVLVAPVLAAAIIPVLEVTFCLVDVGLVDAVIENTQGKSKPFRDGLFISA